MSRKVRATRYLDAENAYLEEIVRDILPNEDYPGTLEVYETLMSHPQFRAKDTAFLAANDRFFLLTILLKRPDANHPWLYDRCREVEANPDGYLDLWAREHYKSTIITFAGAIQEVLADPEITIGLFSHTKDAAQTFLAQIMHEFEHNDLLRECFEDVIWRKPRSQAPSWSVADGLTVRRSSNPKECTIEGHGLLDGMPTGRHFALMIYDDLITEKHVTNNEVVKKVTTAWELSDNLGAGEARKWHIGTRYHFGDTYGIILDTGACQPRLYPATDDGTMHGNLVFMSRKRWEDKVRTQRSTLAAQMLQNPTAGKETTFQPDWFQRYEVRPSVLHVYIICDPSGGKKEGADRTAMVVIGVDAAGNKYLLDGLCHRMTLSERWRNFKRLRNKWLAQPGVRGVWMGYEKYGMQSDLEYFSEKMSESEDHFEIKELNWPNSGGHSKRDRVKRLEPDVRYGRFLLPCVLYVPPNGDSFWHMDAKQQRKVTIPVKGPTRNQKRMIDSGQPFRVAKAIRCLDQEEKTYDLTAILIEEMLFFPFAPHDDLVDAASRIYDMEYQTPGFEEAQQEALGAPDWEDA
jgi:hypothetical protein